MDRVSSRYQLPRIDHRLWGQSHGRTEQGLSHSIAMEKLKIIQGTYFVRQIFSTATMDNGKF